MVKRVFLIGFMGGGKTTIGKFVAKDMGWQFIDMDSYIEECQRKTISSIFSEAGENGFRDIERKAVAELCEKENIIVATGGGAPCFFDNMEAMNRSGLTVYLNVDAPTLCNRLKNARAHRPLLADKTDDELLDYITQKLQEREPYYSKARMIVDGDKLPFSMYKNLIEYFPDDEIQ